MDTTIAQSVAEFHSGEHIHAYRLLGCHPASRGSVQGYVFRVWAPHAQRVSVTGDFNFWNPEDLPMTRLEGGIWEAFSVNAALGQAYKYYIIRPDGSAVYKADPYALQCCTMPDTSSRICELDGYIWHDVAWRAAQARRQSLRQPMSIYEVHLGSWKRHIDGSYYSYLELAEELVPYVKGMGYTHIELMPLMEYPYDPSWGYQVTGYYAPTSRYGAPKEFMAFVDRCHEAGLQVIMDWVPAHFPKDEHGLFEFDGTCCYELSDPQMNEHPDWTTRIYDYGKPEVQAFLISNAVFWLEEYHIDGLRVDAVTSMLYLDYNRPSYKPNRYGGRENLEAIEFLRKLNRTVSAVCRGALMIAEESSAFPLVTGAETDGGLGFSYKWNMGWMNDLLTYMSRDPLYRKWEHGKLTFQMIYAFAEHFILPLSHDEVVHGKCSMIEKMPGDYDTKFSNLRAFYGYQMAQPGKKLSFMGNEFAQFIEWDYRKGLDWLLLSYVRHRQMQSFVRDLNWFYQENSTLWDDDLDWDGYDWYNPDDADHSILSFRRMDREGNELAVLCNFCPVLREGYRVGVPAPATFVPAFSSDEICYGGTGTDLPTPTTQEIPANGFDYSAVFTLPPMSVVYYRVKHSEQKTRGNPP